MAFSQFDPVFSLLIPNRLAARDSFSHPSGSIQKRINNATLWRSKKRREQALDFFGVFLHRVKSAKQTTAKIGGLFKEPVMGGLPTSVMPEPFLSVEFGRVLGQLLPI